MKAWLCCAAATLLGLAACGEAGEEAGNNVSAADATANETSVGGNAAKLDETTSADDAKPDAGSSANASSPAPEIRTLLIGRWTDTGDCNAATEIRDDGSFASPQAGEGRWEQSNEYLTLTGSRETIEIAVQEIDQRTMTTINPQGRIGRWTRC